MTLLRPMPWWGEVLGYFVLLGSGFATGIWATAKQLRIPEGEGYVQVLGDYIAGTGFPSDSPSDGLRIGEVRLDDGRLVRAILATQDISEGTRVVVSPISGNYHDDTNRKIGPIAYRPPGWDKPSQ